MSETEMIAFVFLVITASATIITLARTFANRGAKTPPRELASMDARLARIEQAVEAMSIEVERISEGQRFTTKLLSDRTEGEPVPVERRTT